MCGGGGAGARLCTTEQIIETEAKGPLGKCSTHSIAHALEEGESVHTDFPFYRCGSCCCKMAEPRYSTEKARLFAGLKKCSILLMRTYLYMAATLLG